MRRRAFGGSGWFGGAVAIVLGLASGRAEATTFAPLTIEQITDGSTYIVEGSVEDVWTELDPERMVVWTRARVAITKTFKGPDEPAELVVDSLGGVWGDYSTAVPSMAVFSAGEDVFLFLDDIGVDHHLVPVSKFLGKYSVRRAPGDTLPYVRQWEGKVGETFDARFMPHPAPEYRLYLADLERQVEDRLAVGWDGAPIPTVTLERLQAINARSHAFVGPRAVVSQGVKP